MKKILITGASGYIGRELCQCLSAENKVMGVFNTHKPDNFEGIEFKKVNLTDQHSVEKLVERFIPDVVIHCAAIAHQKLGKIDSKTYMRVNSDATEKLAGTAVRTNSSVQFIFLSSISVYGENNLKLPVTEDHACHPTSEYGRSKLDAERRLLAMSNDGTFSPIILRLAPVYDKEWSFNLDRRILAPMIPAYIKFGSGIQKMSALARPNLVEFIKYLINLPEKMSLNPEIINVCDKKSYSFNQIIQTYKKSGLRQNRPVFSIPLVTVFAATRIAGCIFSGKREWLHSCYEKLASSLVFDTGKMQKTGFTPRHSLETIFS